MNGTPTQSGYLRRAMNFGGQTLGGDTNKVGESWYQQPAIRCSVLRNCKFIGGVPA